jgi:hypothetical protein
MAILKSLMEMDPFMRPIGGPVSPPNTPIQSTTEQPDDVVPDRRFNPLRDLMNRRASEEECEEYDDDYDDQTPDAEDYTGVVSFILDNQEPTTEDYERVAQEHNLSSEELIVLVHNIARELLLQDQEDQDRM